MQKGWWELRNNQFIVLNDGSTIDNIHVLSILKTDETLKRITTEQRYRTEFTE
jgi:hypothetical protein